MTKSNGNYTITKCIFRDFGTLFIELIIIMLGVLKNILKHIFNNMFRRYNTKREYAFIHPIAFSITV